MKFLVLASFLLTVAYADDCADKVSFCQNYKDKCNVWKQYMSDNCKKTCGLCDDCADKVSFCQNYKDKCNVWKQYMSDNCKKTCGLCAPPTKPPTQPSAQPTCGVKGRSHSRIVGGDIATPGNWPWQVTYDWVGSGKGHWCGASIITPNWIVTAAHCIVSKKASDYTLTVGDFELGTHEGYEQKMQIEKIITHERYDTSTYDYDIAMIKLRNAITYKERVKPICLPSSDMDFPAGSECYVTGWGALQESGSYPKRLYQAKVPLISRQQCANTYAMHHGYTITQRMRCAGYDKGKIDACQGDSGGPLVCKKDKRWYLVGAVSWGVGCARKNAYGVYADLTALGSWVQNIMRYN